MSDRDELIGLVREAARINDSGLLEGSHLDRIAWLAADRIIEAGYRKSTIRLVHDAIDQWEREGR